MPVNSQQEIIDRYRKAIKNLIGQPCWSVLAGLSTGSNVSMQFGDRIPRDRPIKNSALTEEERNYDGKYGILVMSTAWRLEKGSEVITGWTDSNELNGPMVQGLDQIIGSHVEEVLITEPGLDMELVFSNSIRLKIFCNQFGDGDDNYAYFAPGITYVVAKGCRMKIEYPTGE